MTTTPIIDLVQAATTVVHEWRRINDGPPVPPETLATYEHAMDCAILDMEAALHIIQGQT